MREREIAEENYQQGKQEGIQQGKKEERQKGMIKQISALKEFNISNDKIIIKIMNDYNVSEEEVKKYL